MKKILVLNNEFPPLWWGQANANKYIFEQFKNYQEYEITLITSSTDKYRVEDFSKNIKIYYLNIWKKWNNYHFQSIKDLLFYSCRVIFFVYKNIKNQKYDLSMCFSWVPAWFLGFIFKITLNIPYIILLRWSDVPFYEKRWYYLDKFILSWLSPFIWGKSKYVTALSKDLKNMAKKIYNWKIDVIYNWIDIKEFFPDTNLRQSQTTINVLFVWRLVERKWIMYLLQAFNILSKRYENICLSVAWDWPLLNEIKTFVFINNLEERIKILWLIKHEDLAYLYQIHHIFVIPSLNEALWNVTQEALASGLPIITTDTWAAELIQDNINWFIIKKESVTDIEEKIEILIQNTKLREKMSNKSREFSLEMSWYEVGVKYKNIFDNII